MASSRANSTNLNSSTDATDNTKRSYYRESWAVIIGINDYQNWPKLRYCVNDADAVEQMLITQYGFKKSNIIKLLNKEATRERIVWALGDQLADPNACVKMIEYLFSSPGTEQHESSRRARSLAISFQ
jgi:hypothetical protein